ncbi:MAG: nicotinate (nicotinamide) nucleotide adenylyltransferase, partial [Oscillospiraceae bacterium]
MKLGIFGGTFNPIHTGHVNLARRCIEALGLDELLLIPTSLPPHKDGGEVSDPSHRLAMCRLAVRDDPAITVSDLEIARGGKSYTVDTLRLLKVQRPGDELFLLMGSDMFYSLERWFCADEVLRLATVVAVAREEGEQNALIEHRDHLNALGARARVVELEPIVTSSTEIRKGEKEDTIPPIVELYLEQNALYGRPLKIDLDLDELTQRLRGMLSRDRFTHTLNVANEALRLAQQYGADPMLAYLAGLLHDICKEFPQDKMLKILEGSAIITDKTFLASPRIWHGHAAAIYIERECSILNAQIIEAVRFHSTGHAPMPLLDQIIYLADLISAERSYPGVEPLRATAYGSLEAAMLEALQFM